MAWLLRIPIEIRMIGLFVIGLFLGSLANYAVYQFCWNPRSISPWSKPDPKAPKRHWSDRLPLLGWFGLARESQLHGRMFWARPMLIELACGIGLAWLYRWETVARGLHDWRPGLTVLPVAVPDNVLHWQYLAHAVLFLLLIAATFIDFDEKTIPDMITIPGTLIGLLLATLAPNSLLSDFTPQSWSSLRLTYQWEAWQYGPYGLAAALLCVFGWWYALMPKLIYGKGGVKKCLCMFVAGFYQVSAARRRKGFHLFQRRWTLLMIGVAAFTTAIWAWGSTARWEGLFSALVGLAFGGGLVWAFRIVASTVMQREALGFGDVTLMAMIGSFVGWQPILLIFFVSPFAGLIIGILQWLITRKAEIAYGPYLAFGTLLVILNWPYVWGRTYLHFFVLGWIIPCIILGCLIPMALMLWGWMAIKRRILGDGSDDASSAVSA